MALFIRLDTKGEWRGTEHRSSMAGQAGICVCMQTPCICNAEGSWEDGISCYGLKDKSYALDSLRQYWSDIAMFRVEDYEKFNMQVTIFEGESLDSQGADWEEMAICTRTVAEYDAQPLMSKIYELHELYEGGEIDEEEYYEELEKIELGI